MRNVLQKGRIGHGVPQLKTTREMKNGDSVVAVSTSYTLYTRLIQRFSCTKILRCLQTSCKIHFLFFSNLSSYSNCKKGIYHYLYMWWKCWCWEPIPSQWDSWLCCDIWMEDSSCLSSQENGVQVCPKTQNIWLENALFPDRIMDLFPQWELVSNEQLTGSSLLISTIVMWYSISV